MPKAPASPLVVTVGKHSVSIYFAKPERGRNPRYVLADYSTGKRVKRSFPTLPEAKAEARRICTLMEKGDAEGASMTGADRAELVRCRDVVSRHGVTVQDACEAFSAAADLVGASGVVEAAREVSEGLAGQRRRGATP